MSQTVFDEKGKPVENPLGLNPDDLKEIGKWKHKDAHCPYCMYIGTLDEFATFNKGTKQYPNKLSKKMAECPDCGEGMRMKTLMEKTHMSVEDFSWWFWENVFLYRMMERVSGDKFFSRVKKWHYDDRQIFWAVYHEFKDAKDKYTVMRDKRAYEEYASQYTVDEEEEELDTGDKVMVTYKCKNCGHEFELEDEYPPSTRGNECPKCGTKWTEIKEVKD